MIQKLGKEDPTHTHNWSPQKRNLCKGTGQILKMIIQENFSEIKENLNLLFKATQGG